MARSLPLSGGGSTEDSDSESTDAPSGKSGARRLVGELTVAEPTTSTSDSGSSSGSAVGVSRDVEQDIQQLDNSGSRGTKPGNQTDYAQEQAPETSTPTGGTPDTGGAASAPTSGTGSDSSVGSDPGTSTTRGGRPDVGGFSGPVGSGTTRDPATVVGSPPEERRQSETTAGGGGDAGQSSFEQGVEAGSGPHAAQGQSIEAQVLEDWPGLSSDDVAVRPEGDQLVVDIDPAAERRLVAEALGRPGTSNKARAVSEQISADLAGSYRESMPGTENKRRAVAERQPDIESPRTGDLPGPEDQRVSMSRDAAMSKVEAARGELGAARDAAIMEAVQEAETDEFTLKVPEFVPLAGGEEYTIEGQSRELSATIEDDGSISFEEQERFGDIDLSLGQFGEGDEVEQAIDWFGSAPAEVGDVLGKAFAGSLVALKNEEVGLEAIETVEDQTGDDIDAFDAPAVAIEAGRIAREQDNPIAKSAYGAMQAPFGLASLLTSAPSALVEGGELLTMDPENVDEIPGAVAGQVAGSASYMADNPLEVAAGGLVSLPVSAGIFGAASAIGPRAGAIARWSIQPGEEALGAAGYRATAGLAGTSAADRWFPNQEPIFFSEEAAIRAGGKVRDSFGEFAADTRGQADLTTEGEQKEDDSLGVPDDDPFRVSDKRLFDPTREFGDADDPSRFIDEPPTRRPLYKDDITDGIAGRGDPLTWRGEGTFEDNWNAQIEAAQESELVNARLYETTLLAESQSPFVDVRHEPSMDTTPAQDVRPSTASDTRADVGTETEPRLDIGAEADIATETRTDQRLEPAFEQEIETEVETEFEFETEFETEPFQEEEDEDPRRGLLPPWEYESATLDTGIATVGELEDSGFFNPPDLNDIEDPKL